MNLKRGKRSGSRSRIGDWRIYSYNEGIKSQEKLLDSDDFQFSIDNVENLSDFSEVEKLYRMEVFYRVLSLSSVGILLLWRKFILR